MVLMQNTTARRPGDLLLDRWMPGATPEERERAHENLRLFAKALYRIAKREVEEEHERSNSTNPRAVFEGLDAASTN